MRSPLTIDDDVLAAARILAAHERKSLGEVISALSRQALRPTAPRPRERNGLTLLPASRQHGAGSAPVTMELVNALRDELP